ncbi:hypothetical protein AB4239_22115, partial [Vibrio sp. 10N.286.45.C10]|uniref:hypothetical protein n=1 Tax=Vibrio sp. 10N.286.45.C10 TaxID=3229695 RepID=UPI00354ED7EC
MSLSMLCPKTRSGFHGDLDHALTKNVAIPLTIHGQSDCHRYQCFVPKPDLVFMVSSTMRLQNVATPLTIHGQSD